MTNINGLFCQIDLLFARIDRMNVSRSLNLCENTQILLRNLDEQDVRSINGVRVTDDILDRVHDKKSFKMALKVSKLSDSFFASCGFGVDS